MPFVLFVPFCGYSLFKGQSLLPLLVRSIRRRSAEEQRSSVRQRQVSSVRAVCAILRSVPIDDDLGTGQKRLFREAAPEKDIRCAGFNGPLFYGPIRLFHIEVNPHVGIRPFHFRHHTFELHRRLGIEFRRKRVMCPYRRRGQNHKRSGGSITKKRTADFRG